MLYFVFYGDFPESLDVCLELGPGETATRNRLLDMASRNPSTFVEAPEMKDKWTALYRRTFLTGKSLDKLSVEEREGEIRKQWRIFLDKDLPRIEAALKQETWIWDSVESDKARSSQKSRFTWGEGDIEITKRPEHED